MKGEPEVWLQFVQKSSAIKQGCSQYNAAQAALKSTLDESGLGLWWNASKNQFTNEK